MTYQVIHADCKVALQELINKGIKVDSIITDPPYELGFLGKSWDKTGIAYDVELWKLALEILKPGGHLLAFGGSRTYHRMACAIEEAGFEIRDQIMWLYGQGFPKSLNISKAIDKMGQLAAIIEPATELAKQWDGWGSALKPAHEPIVMARKPLSEKNIASNVIKHGTGAINIDGCRIQINKENETDARVGSNVVMKQKREKSKHTVSLTPTDNISVYKSQGRFPANLIHDGSDEVEEEFAKYGDKVSGGGDKRRKTKCKYFNINPLRDIAPLKNQDRSTGSASRFFYCSKASTKERQGSKHPTVKPMELMRYLCRLITPPGGTILDPFAGTGTTGKAALEQGFKTILIEREQEYITDIERRINPEFTLEAK